MTSSGDASEEPTRVEKDLGKARRDLTFRFDNAERDWRHGLTLTLLGTALGVYVGEGWVLATGLTIAAAAIFVRPVVPKSLKTMGPQWYALLVIPGILGASGAILRGILDQSSGLKTDSGSSTLLLTLAFLAFAILLAFKAHPKEQEEP